MIVVDASGVIDLILDIRPHSERVAAVVDDHAADLHAPYLLDAEVGQVIRRFLLHRDMRPSRVDDALGLLADLRITRYGHVGLLPRALEFRRNLTVYDALYVALAEALEAPLLTRDAGIARTAGRLVDVVLVP
ncbi:MAG TPA: type II toxin-antitoxin system VapC family toxin [Actinomycetota bacterium]|nr:type II toxin-antitoxin system VapC family toxin [Actinomycetota bacterium]